MYVFGVFGTVSGNIFMAAAYLVDVKLKQWLMIAGNALLLLFFEFGPGTVQYILYGEYYPEKIKVMLNSVSFTTMSIFSILITFSFGYILIPYLPYVVLAIASTICGFILMWLFKE
jgi:hypothetical protein